MKSIIYQKPILDVLMGLVNIKVCSPASMSVDDITLEVWLKYHDAEWKYGYMLDQCKIDPTRIHYSFYHENSQ